MVPIVLFNHKILCIILPLEHYKFELTPYWPTELAPSSIPHKGEGEGEGEGRGGGESVDGD